VEFFSLPELAEQAGFRPCRRCHPDTSGSDPQVERVRRVCRFIETHLEESLNLATLGAEMGWSPAHLQRVFKKIAGISPRQYADACRMGRFKAGLRESKTVTTALYEAGYGSSSRLYEKAPAQLGMTPTTYQKGGPSTVIHYTLTDCPLGRLLLAGTSRGVCAVYLGDRDNDLEGELKSEFSAAHLVRDDAELRTWAENIVVHLKGQQPHLDLPLDVRATAFQWRVWQELRAIPYGRTATYQEIARRLGQPTGARAVARACATNPVSLVIPCHRVVRGDGGLGGYRWGLHRKQALLDQEKEHTSTPGTEE
jgi:AraC family transcriptional regulator of adaptative response/methylated-DNA-[protein]-cysteine methyltransferase